MTSLARFLLTHDRVRRNLCVAIAAIGLLATAAVEAQTGPVTWELRVCADQDNLPYSNRAGDGFENRLARLVAEELGADLTYAWMPLPRQGTDAELMLRLGECDVLIGAADGQEPFLNTIDYYSNATYFVTRSDGGATIESLDDPRLLGLQIGVDRGGPLDFALRSRVPQSNLHHYLASDGADAILRDVAAGRLDVGIVRGAAAGYFAEAGATPMTVAPVTPEIDIPFLALIQPITMAVRRGDDELRDLLNRAIAARWSDIQALLDEYRVLRPAVTAPRPALGTGVPDGALLVGVVLPSQTGARPLLTENFEQLADAARRGAVLADELLGDAATAPLRVLLTSAPTPDVAERAARRLVVADGASALIGGVGDGQAARLATTATDLMVPFINVGDPAPELRQGVCRSTTFSIAPGVDDYLAALSDSLNRADPHAVAIVHLDTPGGQALRERLLLAMARSSASALPVHEVAVEPGQPYYGAAFEAVRASGSDAVVLLLTTDEQLVFLGQYEAAGIGATIFPFPDPGTQLRQYYWTLRADAPTTGATPRFAAWDAAVASTSFSAAYRSRYGQQADAVAWVAYTAVQVVQQAAESSRTDGIGLVRALARTDVDHALDDGMTNARMGADHQLHAPIYTLRLTPPAAGARFQLADITELVGAFTPFGSEVEVCD